MHLEKMGATVHIVGNGKLAVDEALKYNYDLIYMDMQMPIMDGVQAVSLLRKKNYPGAIVALTANAMKEDQEKCLNAGCDDFISKPINRNLLYSITARYLQSDSQPDKNLLPIYSSLLEEDDCYYNLVNKFIENLPGRIDALSDAYKSSDMIQLGKLAHDLKGMGGGYGFNALTDIAARLMFLLEGGNYQAIPAVLDELDDVCKRIYLGAEQLKAPQNKSVAG